MNEREAVELLKGLDKYIREQLYGNRPMTDAQWSYLVLTIRVNIEHHLDKINRHE